MCRVRCVEPAISNLLEGLLPGAEVIHVVDSDGLARWGISAYWQRVLSGGVIVIAVGLNMWRRQREGTV